jgi:hypothetical protein
MLFLGFEPRVVEKRLHWRARMTVFERAAATLASFDFEASLLVSRPTGAENAAGPKGGGNRRTLDDAAAPTGRLGLLVGGKYIQVPATNNAPSGAKRE